ncbi:MAG: iron-containing alcohol dehydrogenase, partial [Oscillospiraceae bacterium]|nr:iron-containing alcohol dehydrogenase [Oscillospiraceae bacterium]
MALDFIYTQPVKIIFGEGKFAQLGEVLQELGVQRCVIACGRHFAPTAKEMQEADSRIVGVFGGVEQNPQLSGVKETARIARETGADAVLGVGGGSAIDTAKFAAAIALGDGEAEDYYYARKPFPAQRLTIIAVPTTAGTGSEVTQVSVVSNGTEKKTINNPVFMPKAAIVDPVLSSTVPPRTTMNTGLDAMAHALEGYWSKNHQPISDLMAI